jgi:SAM-dependent methyltransferase
MAGLDRYNQWVFQRLARHAGRSILEVGCGIGNMTPFWLSAERLTCIDVLPESVALTGQQFANDHRVTTLIADIAAPDAVERLGERRYDTAVCINVLEHIEDDQTALRHMFDILAPGGKLLLFVPAGQYLYGQLDVALGHYRRYSLKQVDQLVRQQGFEIVEITYMNMAGIPGWFLASRVLRREAPPRGMLWLFNQLTPMFIWCEQHLRLPIGQSVVCIAQRPVAQADTLLRAAS